MKKKTYKLKNHLSVPLGGALHIKKNGISSRRKKVIKNVKTSKDSASNKESFDVFEISVQALDKEELSFIDFTYKDCRL